jgi:glucosamine--fructose-6-phosphate aminotransferase (isomerizing)
VTTALARAIAAQPEHLAAMLALDLGPGAEAVAAAQRIWLIGTGTSQHAAELGTLYFRRAGREAGWLSSAAFARSGPSLGSRDVAIVISHTAETSFARAARARVQDSPAGLVTITGRSRGWPEAIETVPAEESETYTTSYTSVLVVLARLSGGADPVALARLPDLACETVAAADEVPVPARCLVIAGAGPAAITAREGALKLREAARVLSEGYEAEYLLHGGAVPLTSQDRLLLLSPESDPDGLTEGLGQAAEAEGVPVSRIDGVAEDDPLLAQIPLTIRLQALAERTARARGQDPDVVITGAWAEQGLWAVGAPREND